MICNQSIFTLITRETCLTFPCMKSFVIGKMKNSKRDSRVMVRSFLSVAYPFAEFAADRDVAAEKFSYCGKTRNVVLVEREISVARARNDRNFILVMKGTSCLYHKLYHKSRCFLTRTFYDAQLYVL